MTWAIENIHRLDARVDSTQLRHRMLSHQPADRLDAAYVKADSTQPAAEAWQAYADHLDALIGRGPTSKVASMRAAKRKARR